MLKKWIVLILAAAICLSACHSPMYNQAEGNIADVKIRGVEARKKSDHDAKYGPSLIMKCDAYIDKRPINLANNPTWLRNHVVIRGDNLPFSYYTRTIANGAGSNLLLKYQSDLDPTVSLTLNYSGTVKGALDLIAAKTGYIYSVHSHGIYWQAYVTKTYDIAFMPGGTDYMMGDQAGSGTGGGSSGGGAANSSFTSFGGTNEFSSLKGSLSIWTDLQTTIKQLLSADGKVTVSQATTSVTVRDRPSNVELVGQYINNMNHNLARQVLVKIQVLEVDLTSDYNYGIDWQMIMKAFHNSPFIINGNYGTPISITALTGQSAIGNIPAGTTPQFGTVGNGNIPSWTILLNALSQQGKASVVTEPRVLCLNNQVSVIRIITTEGYVASIQNTTVGSGGGTSPTGTVTSQVTPGTITTGLNLFVLPKILGNEVYMQVNADLSTNKGIRTFGTAQAQVELPTVAQKEFNQRSKLRSGDTLILSGFRQVKNAAAANQFIESQALGGKAATQANSETILLITPYILPGSA